MLAHRKQGHHLPTLVINLCPDPATDKIRKRRSSRAAGLGPVKENHPGSLWLRAPSNEHYHSLHEWARCIQPLIQQHSISLVSPVSPNSPTFMHPFSGMSASSGNPSTSTSLNHESCTTPQTTHSSCERPLTFSSEPPSLRSKRSDVSSHSSSPNYPGPAIATRNPYPSRTNSPPPTATDFGEYTGDFIEGWTTSQGRSSDVSSRGRESLELPPRTSTPPSVNASLPPGPRETILDRAFQMRLIPGSEQQTPGEESLSSIVKFDALMSEADEKRQKHDLGISLSIDAEEMNRAWDLEESSDDDGNLEHRPSQDFGLGDEQVNIGPRIQRALDFIADRHNGDPHTGAPHTRSSNSCHLETVKALDRGSSRRPKIGHWVIQPAISQRTNIQAQLSGEPPQSPASTIRPGDDPGARENRRQSTSSMKRLSFNDFTKRLSSTSSLLLVQSNTSGGSSRRSSEIESQSGPPVGGPVAHRAAPPAPGPHMNRDEQEWDTLRGCRWRGSVGVFGAGDGGFL